MVEHLTTCLYRFVYGECIFDEHYDFAGRNIIATTNEVVDDINAKLTDRMGGVEKSFHSYDKCKLENREFNITCIVMIASDVQMFC